MISCSISDFAEDLIRSASVFAVTLASSIICAALFSAWPRISEPFCLVCSNASAFFLEATSSDIFPSLAAAKPSAISFCLFSIAFNKGGQTNLTVNQIKMANVIACAINVKLIFIYAPSNTFKLILTYYTQ